MLTLVSDTAADSQLSGESDSESQSNSISSSTTSSDNSDSDYEEPSVAHLPEIPFGHEWHHITPSRTRVVRRFHCRPPKHEGPPHICTSLSPAARNVTIDFSKTAHSAMSAMVQHTTSLENVSSAVAGQSVDAGVAVQLLRSIMNGLRWEGALYSRRGTLG